MNATGIVPEGDIAFMVIIVLLKPVIFVRFRSHKHNAVSMNDGFTEIFAIV